MSNIILFDAIKNNLSGEEVEEILEYEDLETYDDIWGNTPLMMAVNRDNVSVVEVLLMAGSKVNDTNAHGCNLFVNAVNRGNLSIISMLIKAGVDVNARDSWDLFDDGNAFESTDDPSIIRMLLDAGADMESRNVFGRTALLNAIYYGNYPIIQTLLDAGADMEARDKLGHTALLCAINEDNSSVIQTLLDAGADVEAKTKYDINVLEFAAIAENKEIIQMIVNHLPVANLPIDSEYSIINEAVDTRKGIMYAFLQAYIMCENKVSLGMLDNDIIGVILDFIA